MPWNALQNDFYSDIIWNVSTQTAVVIPVKDKNKETKKTGTWPLAAIFTLSLKDKDRRKT